MDRPGQTGYMILNEDGAVISSAGELKNDEAFANSIMQLLNVSSQLNYSKCSQDSFKKLSLVYDDHYYSICLSNRKYHIAKKALSASL